MITQLGDASGNSTDDRRETINAHCFFRPARFLIIDVIPQDITFTAEYFITQVLAPLHQHGIPLSQDAAR
jgi:hypothetical protein